MDKQTTISKQTALIASARRLPIDSRIEIVKAIQESIRIDEGRIRAVDRIAQLIPIAEEVFGCTYDPRRKSETDTCVRNVCARVMRDEEYTYSAIARSMKRHPSSVIVMVHRADEMRDGFFGRDIQAKYNQFIERV